MLNSKTKRNVIIKCVEIMKLNFGFFINKFLKWLNRPALRDCKIHNTAHVGSGSNCISVTMGKYSYMGMNNSVSNVSIGAFCSIASYCAIGGGAHIIDAISTSPVFTKGRNALRVNFAEIMKPINKRVEIGNDVWIGEGVFIVDGIKIGDGVIVGAHSVVTHDVPPYAIVAGTPARILRYRFDPDEIKILLETQWWLLPDNEIKRIAESFDSITNYKSLFNV